MPRDALRQSHVGITLNDHSSKMEERLGVALGLFEDAIQAEFGLTPVLENRMFVSQIVEALNQRYSKDLSVNFERAFQGTATFLKPDGGFWSIKEWGTPPLSAKLV